jgi:hypothetical protein
MSVRMTPMTTIASEVVRAGIAVIPRTMPTEQVIEFNNHLSGRPLWDGHVQAKSGGRGGDPASSQSTCWAMEDVILAPHFLEFAIELFPIAREILSGAALLYSLNAFTTYPREGPTSPDIQEFHRDYDDSKFVALFLLCSDVDSVEDGSHQFVPGSHSDPDGRGVDGREVVNITGPAGTAFLAATRGLHRGVRPCRRPRTLAWARWGVSDPPASYGWDRLSPVPSEKLGARYPADPGLQESLRLVIRR